MITTAHAHKSGVIFHFFPRAFKQKKIKALRPKMTKIASRGGPALISFQTYRRCLPPPTALTEIKNSSNDNDNNGLFNCLSNSQSGSRRAVMPGRFQLMPQLRNHCERRGTSFRDRMCHGSDVKGSAVHHQVKAWKILRLQLISSTLPAKGLVAVTCHPCVFRACKLLGKFFLVGFL